MDSFDDQYEIQHHGQEASYELLFCPILNAQCLGERCMWWVRDWSEEKRQFQYNCAVTLIAVGVNDEALQRLSKKE